MGALEHSGIYLGNARVAELYNDDGVGRAQIVPLWEFLYGQDGEGVRWGSCVYAACTAGEVQLADERVAKVAEKFVRERRRVDYGIFRNNCHLFSMSCIAGKYLPERDFPELLTEGTTSVGELQNMISEKLNDGDEVCWRPAKAINEILGIDNAAVNFNVPTLTGGGKSFVGCNWLFIKLVAMVMVVSPVIEELLFRFPTRFVKHPIFTVAISILFVISHATPKVLATHDLMYFAEINSATIPLFFMALAWCWLYRRTGMIWCTMLSHSLFNIVNFALALIFA